jgi:hypothetical protein
MKKKTYNDGLRIGISATAIIYLIIFLIHCFLSHNG